MVTTELTQRAGMADIANMWQALGECIAKSQLMGCQNVEQGRLIAMTCLMRGVDPLTFHQSYDIIKGKVSKKADRMLAEFYGLGGRYKIVSRTSELASISLSFEGQTAEFSLSWEEAQKEPFTKDKDGKIKTNYATPRIRMQMLWARVVSDGIRVVCPQICSGIYTPEEIGDIEDGEVVSPPAETTQQEYSPEVKAVLQAVAAENKKPEIEQLAAATATTEPTVTAPATVTNAMVEDMASSEQVHEIEILFTAIKASAQSRTNAMGKRNVTRWEDLTSQQAAELINALREKLPAQADPNGPITGDLEKQIQEEILVVAQTPGGAQINDLIKKHLDIYGVLLSQLSYKQGATLLHALKQRQAALFTQMALRDRTVTAEGNA